MGGSLSQTILDLFQKGERYASKAIYHQFLLSLPVLQEQHLAPLEQELGVTRREILQAYKKKQRMIMDAIEGSSRCFTEVDQQPSRTAQEMTII
jgi:hypothetical protein